MSCRGEGLPQPGGGPTRRGGDPKKCRGGGLVKGRGAGDNTCPPAASPRWPGRVSPPTAISAGLPPSPSAKAHAPRRLLHHRRSGGSSTPNSTPLPLRPRGITRGCWVTR
ncbi:hypothetical protein PVAP13_5KG442200 [Panicum virgatum]|uniref:Uncharacterized protein n=1 Tax=Panicum virgatum TaxID=38727 RepID=A0A8T0SQH1_PANVG|nr:hypothetical protein PVAP13_5KG442200 [Panicum virgatum]